MWKGGWLAAVVGSNVFLPAFIAGFGKCLGGPCKVLTFESRALGFSWFWVIDSFYRCFGFMSFYNVARPRYLVAFRLRPESDLENEALACLVGPRVGVLVLRFRLYTV